MGIDILVMLPCDPKRALGAGDPDRGGLRLVELLKKRGLLQAATARADEDHPVAAMVITVHGGAVPRSFTGAELIAETAPLDEHGETCATCPANGFGQPYGCWAHVPYPISAAAEAWLVSRVEPSDRVGGKLLLQQLRTGAIDGEPIARLRRGSRAVFAAEVPATRVLEKGWLRSTAINTDHLLHALLGRAPTMIPEHGLLILIWLGAVSIDGRPPAEIDDVQVRSLLLSPTTMEARFDRTDLVLGPPPGDQSTAELRILLKFLYVSWIVDAPTWLDA